MRRVLVLGMMGVICVAMWPAQAAAMCGMFVPRHVDGASQQKLLSEATQVVLMRDKAQTVLSMRSSYKGPVEDFAMIVPVPIVLNERDVRVLKPEVFDAVNAVSAPRLVEYSERDPCVGGEAQGRGPRPGRSKVKLTSEYRGPVPHAVEVRGEFQVGEYEVVMLNATESTALSEWLTTHGYAIPSGADALLAQYIQQGMYFFVARVDVTKVKFDNTGRAMLSPLRFHYGLKDFQLPVRLGLINTTGPQDLLIHILSREGRYELANYPNVSIPTNVVVREDVREDLDGFYAALFDDTLARHPGAVVTEYVWESTLRCDPCTTRAPLSSVVMASLGEDVIDTPNITVPHWPSARRAASIGPSGGASPPKDLPPQRWTLTRLHARYTADELKQDLIFRRAAPLIGGHGWPTGSADGSFKVPEPRWLDTKQNQFQALYMILNAWKPALMCKNPHRGTWLAVPQRENSSPVTTTSAAFSPRDRAKLSELVVNKAALRVNLLK